MAGASALLKGTFVGASLVSAVELVQRPNLSPRRPVCLTLCDIAYLLCNMLTVTTLCWTAATSVFPSQTQVLTDVSIAGAMVWLTFSAVCQRLKGLCASNFLFSLHALHFVAAVSDLLVQRQHVLVTWSRKNDVRMANQSSLLALTTLGSFLYACFRSSPVVDKNTHEMQTIAHEETFSSCGKLVGSAVFRYVVKTGLLSKYDEKDILPLVKRLKCRRLVALLPPLTKYKW
ncbi:uncharacterized protein LOC142559862 [Dermacentor variabilis]|uniref:uncharacterized protein LOC142559862 n=1 Tax=Dermacentor variabilis TaxID=34621 RepID=UPI003F5C7B5D